jgi:uncharacterized protein YukE
MPIENEWTQTLEAMRDALEQRAALIDKYATEAAEKDNIIKNLMQTVINLDSRNKRLTTALDRALSQMLDITLKQ